MTARFYDLNDPYFPIEMDLGVLIPDDDSLDEIMDAHAQYDDPDEPLILSSITNILYDLLV